MVSLLAALLLSQPTKNRITVLTADGKPLARRPIVIYYPGRKGSDPWELINTDGNGVAHAKHALGSAKIEAWPSDHSATFGEIGRDGIVHLLATVPCGEIKVRMPKGTQAKDVDLFGSGSVSNQGYQFL